MNTLKYIVLVLCLSFSAVWAGDVEDADSAFLKKDYATALKKYGLAAAIKDAYAQTQVGNIYNEGLGVKQDYAEAVSWYTLTTAQGDAMAQFNLAGTYATGQGAYSGDRDR